MSDQYVLLTSGGSPVTNFYIQQWLDSNNDASSNTSDNQDAMYDHEDETLLHRRRRSSALVNTAAYLHTPPAGEPATEGSTTETLSNIQFHKKDNDNDNKKDNDNDNKNNDKNNDDNNTNDNNTNGNNTHGNNTDDNNTNDNNTNDNNTNTDDNKNGNNGNNSNNTNDTMKPHAAAAFANMISPFPDLASLQTEALTLALKRGADDAYVRGRLGANAAGLSGWVEWERKKEAYDICKAGRVKGGKVKKGVRGRKVAPPPKKAQLGDVEAEAAGGLVPVVGREFNRDPGAWALQTFADNQILLAGGAKRVGTLLREQKAEDEATLSQVMGTRSAVAEEGEKDRQAMEEAGRVLTALKMRKSGEGKREGAQMYRPLKKGDARLWQH